MTTTLGELPNLADSFSKLKIALDVEEKVCTQDNAIALAIYAGLQGQRVNQVIKYIKEAATDNRSMVVDVIGEELLTKIENL